MTRTVTWIDSLRIERVVWMLDQRLYDLPRRSRIAKRREVRENLIEAAHDLGTSDTLRRLGDSRRLAIEYRTAEFGDAPRPSWIAAAVFATGTSLLFNGMLGEASSAFGDGVTVANPNATGTFTWSGIQHLQDTVTLTIANGHGTSVVSGAWAPVSYAIWIVGTVLVGRLWRALPKLRLRHGTTTTS